MVCGIFGFNLNTSSCGMWDLVPPPGMEPGPHALGVQNLYHWTTREVPVSAFLKKSFFQPKWWPHIPRLQGLSIDLDVCLVFVVK